MDDIFHLCSHWRSLMDENTTQKIYFSFDGTVNHAVVREAIAYLGRTFRLPMKWVRGSDTGSFDQLGVDEVEKDFRLRYGISLEVQNEKGNCWQAMQAVVKKEKPFLTVIASEVQQEGLLGGGMRSWTMKINVPILYLNSDAQWQNPDMLFMPLDSASETRQKFGTVAQIASKTRSMVAVKGILRKNDAEEMRHLRVYVVQANNFMVDRGIFVKDLDVSVAHDLVSDIMNSAMELRCKWLCILSNPEGGFKKSCFQQLCENAGFPLLLIPFQEVIGTGGSGY